MKTVVIGRTDATLTLNKCKSYIRGRVEAIIDVTNDEQRRELAGLEKVNLITIIDDEENKIEFPRITPRQLTEQERAIKSEAETQQMGSRAIVSTGDGLVEGRMMRCAVDDINDSDRTKESVEALKKMEQEEIDAEIEDNLVINEDKLDPSEQMGRKAIISTGANEKKVGLVNNSVTGSERTKKKDPFIDKKENAEREKLSATENKTKPVSTVSNKDAMIEDYVPELSEDELFIDNKSSPPPPPPPPPPPEDEDLFIEI